MIFQLGFFMLSIKQFGKTLYFVLILQQAKTLSLCGL